MSHSQIDELESLTRSGLFGPVVKSLQNLNIKKIPREHAARYANLANRVDFSQFAFRILNPILRDDKALATPPNDAEKCEYAEALRRMGLIGEAMECFSEVDTIQHPVALLRSAFCLFMQWKYEEAIPYLQTYLKAVQGDEYARRIATLNLAAAYVAERFDNQALQVLETLEQETKSAKNHLLYLNSLELKTQVLIRIQDWAGAEAAMTEASASVTDAQTRYARYIRKWRSIAHSLKSRQIAPELYQCRTEALTNADWETVRECDLYMAHITHDKALLKYLYFGTPYPTYRRRILDLVGPELPGDSEFLWTIGSNASRSVVVDLTSGTASNGSALEIGQVPHRLLVLLCRDFYRPLSNGTAFSNLYPGEHFTQEGSTNRVSQSVRRLRSWLQDLSADTQIESVNGGYRLIGDGSLAIRIPREPLPLNMRPLEWNAVRTTLAGKEFSKRDIMQNQKYSDSAAKRLLNWAVETGRAEPIAWGAKAKYRLVG